MTGSFFWYPARGALCLLASLVFIVSVANADAAGRQVAALGRIVPGDGVIHVAAPAGETGQAIVVELKVKSGDEVKAGDLLATLMTQGVYRQAVAAATGQEQAAIAGVKLAEVQAKQLDLQAAVFDAQIAAAQAEAKAAQEAVAQAKAAVDQANAAYQAGLFRLQGEIDEHNRVIEEWDPGTRDREEIKFQQKVLSLEINKLNATHPSQIAVLEAAVTTAADKATAAAEQVKIIEAEKAAFAGQQAIAAEQVAQTKASQAVAEIAVAQAKARLEQAFVRATLDGVILSVNAMAGEAVGPDGVVSLANRDKMYVEAEVYVDDIALVKVGQSATITGQVLGTELTGKVERIAPQVAPNDLFSRDPTAFADKRVVMVRVQFDDPAPVRNLIGAQVTVKIQPE